MAFSLLQKCSLALDHLIHGNKSADDEAKTNAKATTLLVIDKCLAAIEWRISCDYAEDNKNAYTEAVKDISEIREAIERVTDERSRNAEKIANEIFLELDSITYKYFLGDTSGNFGKAKKSALTWLGMKSVFFGKKVREDSLKTVSDLNKRLVKAAEANKAKKDICSIKKMLNDRVADIESQKAKVEEIKKKRDELSKASNEYLEKTNRVKADLQDKKVSKKEADELVLSYQQEIKKLENQIELYDGRIDQQMELINANADRFNTLIVIIENLELVALNDVDTMSTIAGHINMEAIHAFLAGSTSDVVIDKICEIDAVANIISKRMKISAEEAKFNLSSIRGFVSVPK